MKNKPINLGTAQGYETVKMLSIIISIFLTVFEVWLAQVQVLAGACRAVLGAQGESHVVDLLSERVEGAEDFLHAFAAHHELGAGGVGGGHVGVVLRQQLAGVDGALGLGASLDGQRLNDFARGALRNRFGAS